MRTFTIHHKRDLASCLYYLAEQSEQDWPLVVTCQPEENKRSVKQNRLSFLWYKAAADQLKDQAADECRAYCKLHFGIGILKAENPEFAAQYDAVIRGLTYEQKLLIMQAPIEFPVTSLMSVKAMAQYLEAVEVHLSGQGVDLPKPDDLYNSALGRKTNAQS